MYIEYEGLGLLVDLYVVLGRENQKCWSHLRLTKIGRKGRLFSGEKNITLTDFVGHIYNFFLLTVLYIRAISEAKTKIL